MPPSRHLHQPLISGLGVAGSLLSAIVVTFALAGGLVAYSLTSDDPLARGSDALLVESLRTDAERPIVLRRAQPAAAARSSARARPAAATAAPRRRATAHGSLTGSVVGRARDRYPQDAGGGGGERPEQGADPLPGRALAPVAAAVDATAQAVDATTGSLDHRLQAIVDALDTLLTGGPPAG